MALFTWHPQYMLGIPEMDADHAHLFALADQLHAAVAQGAPNDSIRACLAALIDHVRAHSAHEEELMVRCRYPGLEEHKAEHQLLAEKAIQFQRDLLTGHPAARADMFRFLRDWLALHMANCDRCLAVYLKNELAGAKPSAV